MSLQQGGRVHLTFAPDGMTYPTTSTTVQMQPLRLTVARSPLLRQLLATLSLADRWAPRAAASPFLLEAVHLVFASDCHANRNFPTAMPIGTMLHGSGDGGNQDTHSLYRTSTRRLQGRVKAGRALHIAISSLNDASRAPVAPVLYSRSSSPGILSIHLHDAPLNGCGRSIGKIDTLNIWTAPLQAEISEAGPVRTRRTDLLLNGKSGQGGGSSSWDRIHQSPFPQPAVHH